MKRKAGYGFLCVFSLYPGSYFAIHGILFSSQWLPNNSYFKYFPLCHVINCAVGQISLLQISLEPRGSVPSINICFKILLFPFQCEFSYSSLGLLFRFNNLRKENEQLLIKQVVKKDQELLHLIFVGN